MTATSVVPWSWPNRRWWGLVALVFGVQLGLIFWLGGTAPIRPRPAPPAVTIKLAGNVSAEWLALNDPTLFARSQPQGLPEPARLSNLPLESQSLKWPEPTNHPLLVVNQLGSDFSRLMEPDNFNSLPPPAKPKPELTLPFLPPQAISADRSAVRLEGGLAQRRLTTPLALPSWPSPDILTSSVVQLLVDAEGIPRSFTLLSRSGFREADQNALDQAKAARFEPLSRNPASPTPDPTANLSRGRMVFLWHTIPRLPTNTPAVTP